MDIGKQIDIGGRQLYWLEECRFFILRRTTMSSLVLDAIVVIQKQFFFQCFLTAVKNLRNINIDL